MDSFIPKSLDELDNDFFNTVRSADSGRQDIHVSSGSGDLPEADDYKDPKPETPEQEVTVKMPPVQNTDPVIQEVEFHENRPEKKASVSIPEFQAEKTEMKPAQMPPVPPRASIPITDARHQANAKDSLIPKQMFYKAAPMQSPLPQANEENSPYVMPKDYALYGKDAMRINVDKTPQPEPQQDDYESRLKRHKKKKAVSRVITLFMIVVIILSALTGVLAYAYTVGGVSGRHVFAAEQTTKGPYITKGDLIIVKEVNSIHLKQGDIICFTPESGKGHSYGIVTAVAKDDSHSTFTVKTVDEKSVINEQMVSSSVVTGRAVQYFPKVGTIVRLSAVHPCIAAMIAGAVLLVLVLLLILNNRRPAKKKEHPDD